MAIAIGDDIYELEIIGFDRTEGGQHYYHCRCSCGNVVSLRDKDIGRSNKSCGCLRRRNTACIFNKSTHVSRVGRTYGDFKVTAYLGTRDLPSSRCHEYEVQCVHCLATLRKLATNLKMLNKCKCQKQKPPRPASTSVDFARLYRDTDWYARRMELVDLAGRALIVRDVFTDRQHEIVAMAASDMSQKKIATALGISPDGVRRSLRAIEAKARRLLKEWPADANADGSA